MDSHIVVLGAGYAGLIAAKAAAKKTGAKVTLVNERDRFVERVRAHQLAAGQRLRELSLSDLVAGSGVRLVVDRVTGIDADAKTVRLAGAPEEVRYDTLIYALGGRADLGSVPGVAEHAETVSGLEDSQRLRARLAHGGTVAVVGGGLTGIETAAELAESHPEATVRLVTDGMLGEKLSRRGRDHLWRTFHRLGVEVTEHAQVAKVAGDGVWLEDGGHISADTVVWATGFRVPDLAREAGFAVDRDGRMVVDDTMRSVSHPEVYGVGDAAAIPAGPGGQTLRMACATGLPSGQKAAYAIAARMAGRTPKPLRFRYAQQCISLGRRDGLIQFVHPDDSPREAVLTGRTAARVKETIVRATIIAMRHPTMPTNL
ncbi:NAD(P)/FAD-dependent oxidoreductase [Thermostaphylospora chromogena]|uniref:NADH dehydrogenase, FAD-containing subunit n=1 Tax=Thermostaphylospora chromogena TaxID=35622 RepID=A0A1H1H091_9ACTN|nr:FAD-dependent oxidoreductase [Thermostaphylospora chromogena]SDR18854.1 NADH dehydrogenase, FAD-containing subunit [Thermostaphylospora chromogena]